MTNATVQRQRVLRAPTLSVVSSVLATAVVLLAPFTWSYVASVGRPTDPSGGFDDSNFGAGNGRAGTTG